MARRLLILVLCGVFVAGCGSSKDESVNGLLKDTFAGGKSVKSGELNVQLDANLQGVQSLKGPVQLRVTGPFQSTGSKELPKFDFTLSITSNGQTFTAGGTSVGDKGYISFQNQAYAVSDKLFQQFKNGYLQSQSKSKNKSAPSLGTLGIDPRRWLVGAHKEADADVAGTKTAHIAAGIDVGQLLNDVNRVLSRASSVAGGAAKNVPNQITPAQQKQIEQAVQSAKVDIYTGKDDHALRKIDVAVQLKPTGSTFKGGTVHFALQIADLNEDQTIEEPKNAQPLDNLLAQL